MRTSAPSSSAEDVRARAGRPALAVSRARRKRGVASRPARNADAARAGRRAGTEGRRRCCFPRGKRTARTSSAIARRRRSGCSCVDADRPRRRREPRQRQGRSPQRCGRADSPEPARFRSSTTGTERTEPFGLRAPAHEGAGPAHRGARATPRRLAADRPARGRAAADPAADRPDRGRSRPVPTSSSGAASARRTGPPTSSTPSSRTGVVRAQRAGAADERPRPPARRCSRTARSHERTRAWIRDNDCFRRDILELLRQRRADGLTRHPRHLRGAMGIDRVDEQSQRDADAGVPDDPRRGRDHRARRARAAVGSGRAGVSRRRRRPVRRGGETGSRTSGGSPPSASLGRSHCHADRAGRRR